VAGIRKAVSGAVSKVVDKAVLAVQTAATAVNSLLAQNVPEIELWYQVGRIGGNLTPAIVSGIMSEADGGRPARLIDLFHECRQKDAHLQATMQARELSLLGLDWSLSLPQEANDDEKAVAALCTQSLENCNTFPLLIAHMVGEGTAFFAWAEAIWRYETEGDLAGHLVHAEFKPVQSRRFAFRQSDGKLVFINVPGTDPSKGVDLMEEFPLGNFIGYQPRVNGDVPAREGLARPLTWMALFRNWGFKDWMKTAEISWKPYLIGKVKSEATTEDVNLLQSIIRTLQTTGKGIITDRVEVEAQWPKGANGAGTVSMHRLLVEHCGMEMSKAVIGSTLVMDAGDRGARSLGEVQEKVRGDIREADAKNLGPIITEYVIKPWYKFNYGNKYPVPKFVFNTEDGIDLEKLANAVAKLAGVMDIPQEWVRNRGGIRAPVENEELCRGVTSGNETDPTDPDGQDQDSGNDGAANDQEKAAA
jgi:phage gp29-like protein